MSSVDNFLNQPPPPTLREILAAYKAKGDGDREMLLAMLNAKSAEDQRIANTAALHRSLIDLQRDHFLSSPSSSPRVTLPPIRDHIHHHPHLSRKRQRNSPSPPPHTLPSQNSINHHSPSPIRDLPPSPDSSNSQRSFSSDTTSHHHRERGAMAIGSLLTGSAQSRSQHLIPTKPQEDSLQDRTADTPRTAHALSHSRKSSSSL